MCNKFYWVEENLEFPGRIKLNRLLKFKLGCHPIRIGSTVPSFVSAAPVYVLKIDIYGRVNYLMYRYEFTSLTLRELCK
jgi:hypothetical protein